MWGCLFFRFFRALWRESRRLDDVEVEIVLVIG
jgi:hypothetical protein